MEKKSPSRSLSLRSFPAAVGRDLFPGDAHLLAAALISVVPATARSHAWAPVFCTLAGLLPSISLKLSARSEAPARRGLPSSPWLPNESLPSLLVLFELGSCARAPVLPWRVPAPGWISLLSSVAHLRVLARPYARSARPCRLLRVRLLRPGVQTMASRCSDLTTRLLHGLVLVSKSWASLNSPSHSTFSCSPVSSARLASSSPSAWSSHPPCSLKTVKS
jgi:hypothetical protein